MAIMFYSTKSLHVSIGPETACLLHSITMNPYNFPAAGNADNVGRHVVVWGTVLTIRIV